MNEEVKRYLEPGKKNLLLVYISLLTGILISTMPIIGGAFAYANLNNEDIRWRSHYIFAFRTFIIGLIGFCIYVITSMTFIGSVVYTVVFIWFTVRVILGVRLVHQGLPHPNPITFWIK